MMHGREKSDSAIVAGKPTNKRLRSQRSGGAKGGGQGECEPAKARAGHRTGQTVHRRWSAYGEPPISAPRHSPKAGAVCGNSARTDLSGGRSAMTVLPHFTLSLVGPDPKRSSTRSTFAYRDLWNVRPSLITRLCCGQLRKDQYLFS